MLNGGGKRTSETCQCLVADGSLGQTGLLSDAVGKLFPNAPGIDLSPRRDFRKVARRERDPILAFALPDAVERRPS